MISKNHNLKKIITAYKLQDRTEVLNFIKGNPENLNIEELSRIAELVNNNRSDTAAYYTDPETLELISQHLPNIDKEIIHILEPSVGVGNFIQILINHYANAKKLIIDVNDIDPESIELTKALNKYRNIPANVVINYTVHDFLSNEYTQHYDLVIGNPPFMKLTSTSGLDKFSKKYNDTITTNISGFFIQQSTLIGSNIVMIMPKYFLSNADFKETRKRISKLAINKILDFGEKGFKGVLIETIALFISTEEKKNLSYTYSVTKKLQNIVKQDILTSEEYPSWLLYRDRFFEDIASHMEFGAFKVFRDRQLTKSVMKDCGEIKVLKSRNINRDGSGFTEIPGYDSYINESELSTFTVSKYLSRDDVYLSPNMTYYPRVVTKPKNTIVNGSVAILEKVTNSEISDKQLKFLSSKKFELFYRIARNYSTRSLNIDKSSVYFFGLYK